MKSTINIILRFSALLLLCILLAFLSFLAYYCYTGIDWGYPDGEISFVGLTKEDVAKKLGGIKSIYNGTSKIVVAINGDNYKYFDKPDDILKNEFVSKSNCWGVNYKSHKRVFYLQILIFGDDGRVKSQYIKKYWDGL